LVRVNSFMCPCCQTCLEKDLARIWTVKDWEIILLPKARHEALLISNQLIHGLSWLGNYKFDADRRRETFSDYQGLDREMAESGKFEMVDEYNYPSSDEYISGHSEVSSEEEEFPSGSHD